MAMTLIALLVIASAAGLFWMLRSQPQTVRRRSGAQRNAVTAAEPGETHRPCPGGIEKLKSTGLYWGVEMGTPGCEAARQLMGQQYPFEDAPELPLNGCSSATCTCQFKGLRDQRSLSRRSGDDRRENIRFDKQHPERRNRRGRRRSDRWNDHTF